MRAPIAVLLFAASQVVQPTTATVSGRVVEKDSNRPLPRMVVRLISTPPSREVAVRTAEDGTFTIADVPAGRYALQARPDEHRAEHVPRWFGEEGPNTLFFAAPPRYPIDVRAGEGRSGIEIALARALGIEGRVVLDADQPLANVSVSVSRADGRPSFAFDSTTNERGEYRVFGLGAGRYRVCARVQNRAEETDTGDNATLAATCYPSSLTESDAADVTLATRDATGIDIYVQRVGGRSITGTVLDAAGLPAEGAFVSAMAPDVENGSSSGSTTTRGGAFQLRGLAPRKYIVSASLGGAMRGDPDPPARERELAYATVDASALETSTVSLALTKARRLRGRVRIDGRNATGRGDLRLVIHVRHVEVPILEVGPPPSATVNDDLSFELPDIFHVAALIGVGGLPDRMAVKAIRAGDRDITYLSTDLGDVASLDIVLTDRPARPKIRATDETGAPVLTYMAVAFPRDPANWAAGPFIAQAQVDADGVTVLPSLAPGTYLFAALSTVDAMLLSRDRSRIAQLASLAVPVTLGERDARTIDLRVVSLPEKR